MRIEQVRKRGLPPLLLGLDERGQAPLPDLFYSHLFYSDLFYVWILILLKRSAASEACIDVVPPFELVPFTELPAEQDDTTVAE